MSTEPTSWSRRQRHLCSCFVSLVSHKEEREVAVPAYGQQPAQLASPLHFHFISIPNCTTKNYARSAVCQVW